jgi:hypothetical protein
MNATSIVSTNKSQQPILCNSFTSVAWFLLGWTQEGYELRVNTSLARRARCRMWSLVASGSALRVFQVALARFVAKIDRSYRTINALLRRDPPLSINRLVLRLRQPKRNREPEYNICAPRCQSLENDGWTRQYYSRCKDA